MSQPQAHFNLATRPPNNPAIGPLSVFCLAGAADVMVNLCVRPILRVAHWPPERRKTLLKLEALTSLWRGEFYLRIKGVVTPAVSYALFYTIRDVVQKLSRTLVMSKNETTNKTTIKVVQNYRLLTNFTSGALAGFFTGCMTHPWQRFVYLNTAWRMQAYETLAKRKNDAPLTGFRSWVGPEHSILSLYRWFFCGSILSVGYYGLLFGLYHSANELSLSMQRSHHRTAGLDWLDSGEKVSYLERSFYAMGAAMIARIVTFPLSKVLSILHSREGKHYKTARECFIINWKIDGPVKFMSSVTNNMSLPLTAAFTLVVFDMLGDKLKALKRTH